MFDCCYYLVEISMYDQVLTNFNVVCLLWMQYGNVMSLVVESWFGVILPLGYEYVCIVLYSLEE